MFFTDKHKEEWLVLSLNDKYYKLIPESGMSDSDRFCGIVFRSRNYEKAEIICRLLTIFQDRLDKTEDKILKEIAKLDLSNKLTTGQFTVKMDNCGTISNKCGWNEPDTIYAVEGVYPHTIIIKYTIVCEDNYNYCLRSVETGNLSLLPKSICFNNKTDAVEYQNELIQFEFEKMNKGQQYGKEKIQNTSRKKGSVN